MEDKELKDKFLEVMEIKAKAQVIVEKCIKNWGFPFIIKWRVGVSSIKVYTINERKDIEKLKIDYSSESYMAEEFLPDKIWCIDAIVKDGKVLSNLYTWLPFTNLSTIKLAT